MPLLARAAAFYRRPPLEGDEPATYRRHLAFALLTAAGDGLLANAPSIAIKAMAGPTWTLNARLFFSGLGMLFTLYLGSWMAHRAKMPFVRIPGLAFAACCLLMAPLSNPYLFLLLWGVGSIFEMITRPPVTAILRFNYAPQRRGAAVGRIRQWESLVYLVGGLAVALLLQLNDSRAVISALMAAAALAYAASFAVFGTIRVHEDAASWRPGHKPELVRSFRDAFDDLARDRRFLWYTVAGFLFGFSGLLYSEQTRGFFKDLRLGYLWIQLFTDSIPCAAQWLTTGLWGRWFDRTPANRAWVPIRIGWGLDPLLLVLGAVAWRALGPWAAAAVLPILLGRLARGGVMGGSWVLWWRVGIADFAPPGGDTSRYMGILTFFNGLMRLTAAALSSLLVAAAGSTTAVLLLGGSGVLASAAFSWRLAVLDRRRGHPPTIADFEHQFPAAAAAACTPTPIADNAPHGPTPINR